MKPQKKLQIAPAEAIQATAFDAFSYQDMAERSSRLRGFIDTHAGADIFSALHQSNPQAAPHKMASVFKSMMDMAEYRALKQYTVLSDLASAMGTIHMGPEILAAIEKLKESQKKQAEEASKKQKGKPQPKPGNGPAQQAQPGDEGDDGQPQPGEGESQPGEGDEEGELSTEMRAAVRRAAQEALEKAEEFDQICRTWGISPGELAEMSPDQAMELADSIKNNRRFTKVADMLGRFVNLADAADAQSPTHGHDEIVDITTGSHIERALPSELGKLLDARKLLFYKDFLEHNVFEYELQGVEPMAKGPIVVLEDVSGSMNGARSELARAISLSLLHRCEKENRYFSWTAFDTVVQGNLTKLPHQPVLFRERLKMASLTSGGGTNFDIAFSRAMKARNESKTKNGQELKADFVIITDMDCELSAAKVKEIVAYKKAENVRIFVLAIGREARQNQTLKVIADKIYQVERAEAGVEVNELIMGVR